MIKPDPERASLAMTLLLAVVIAILLPIAASSHHLTNVRFDTEADSSISGTITRVDWRNPHVYMYVEAPNDNNEQVVWEVEGPPPATLRRAGWSRETIEIGAQVTITGNPGRNPADNIFLFDTLALGEGESLSLQQIIQNPAQMDAGRNETSSSIAGIWGTNFSYEANVKLIATSQLALTEKGKQAVASYVEVTDNPALNCMPGSTPPAVMLVPDIKLIEVNDNTVVIRGEHEDIARTVYLDQDSHEGAAESLFGHSIGRWEGNTLLIDTTHFTPHRQGNAVALPSGEQKHLVERLVLNEEGSRLTYSYELEDPEYLVGKVTDQIEWTYRPDLEYVNLPCDVENARKFAL